MDAVFAERVNIFSFDGFHLSVHRLAAFFACFPTFGENVQVIVLFLVEKHKQFADTYFG